MSKEQKTEYVDAETKNPSLQKQYFKLAAAKTKENRRAEAFVLDILRYKFYRSWAKQHGIELPKPPILPDAV